MKDNTMFVKGSIFEKSDLMLIDSATILGFLLNLKILNQESKQFYKQIGIKYLEEEKINKKQITFTRAKTEEEKQIKREKRDRREREIISLAGLLKIADVFSYDNEIILGYLLQFRKLSEQNREICKNEGVAFFEKHHEQKKYEKLEKERAIRKKEKEEEEQKKREQIRIAEYQTEDEQKVYKKRTVEK